METKKQIRKQLLAERNVMSKESVEELSEAICEWVNSVLNTQKDLNIRGIYGYYPHGNEVSLMLLYKRILENQIPLAFPKVSGATMDFYQVATMEDFLEGAFHIMEPKDECQKVEWEHAICLVPGSVFDRKGNRYGYGKGYYDKYFDLYPDVLRVGIAYELQVKEEIPVEDTDVKMQMLVTQNGKSVFDCI